jgi:hypothetical protein
VICSKLLVKMASKANRNWERRWEAGSQLQAIRFPLVLSEKTQIELADKFNTRTLYQVLGLAQILAREKPITVRGAFYRAVSAGLYPGTQDVHYNACQDRIKELRRGGFIPYSWIVDNTRYSDKPSSWAGLEDYVDTVADAYRKNLWQAQEEYIEFFVEKDAMAGVITPVTRKYDVTLSVIRGYASETFVHSVSELWRKIEKPIIAYYLGDFDPAGLKIGRDLKKRLAGFLKTDEDEENADPMFDQVFGSLGMAEIPFTWKRLAITEEDFKNPRLFSIPVKRRGAAKTWLPYLRKYGDRCIEVDAIPSSEIRKRVEETILSHIDEEEWKALKKVEEEEKKTVRDTFEKLFKK